MRGGSRCPLDCRLEAVDASGLVVGGQFVLDLLGVAAEVVDVLFRRLDLVQRRVEAVHDCLSLGGQNSVRHEQHLAGPEKLGAVIERILPSLAWRVVANDNATPKDSGPGESRGAGNQDADYRRPGHKRASRKVVRREKEDRRIAQLRARLGAAERERAKNDELFAKMEAGAKGAALKEEAEGDQAGLKRLAEAARDVRSALQAAGVDTSEMTPDQLAGVVAEKLDDLAAADELEKAVRRHLPVADGYEDSDSPLRMVESAGSTIEFTAKQIRAAWDALDTKATPSPVPYPGALRSGEGLAEAIRAQLAALRGERDDLVVQLGAKTREVEDARRDLADEALAQLRARTDCGAPTGCGECVGCLRQSVAETHQAARFAHDDQAGRIAKLDAEVAHLKAKRATSDAERDAARETLQRVVALCQAELEHVPSMLSTATRSLAWVLLREVSPETVHRLHAQDMATAQNVWPASGSIEFFAGCCYRCWAGKLNRLFALDALPQGS